MRVSNMLLNTLREVPAEAESQSHKLMLRAGLIRKLAAGVYSWLPLGLRALQKAEQIVREEMDAAGAQELLMSALLPAEAYQASGRWEVFGEDMFRLIDRGGRDFCLGPTHEEIFTDTVKATVKSYKQLPLTLYQIQNKYRDERRPRFGVMRSREFVMKDAYSFDMDAEGLDVSYDKMYAAYRRIFERMGLDFIVVDADSGAMGGSGSQEFMVKSDTGEDLIAYCPACGYAANEEKAACIPEELPAEEPRTMEKVHTPNVGTIDDLEAFFHTDRKKFVKTILYRADGKLVAGMVRGDRDINEVKLKNHFGANELELADAESVRQATGAEVGFAGPIGLDESVPVVMDLEVAKLCNFLVGANETDYHYINVNCKDFTPEAVIDLRTIVEGDKCPRCGQPVSTTQGIEVGHIFKLGTKYTDALDCTCLDENGKAKSLVMGCYGIGVSRAIAAVIEQYSDDKGICWPVSVAPYHVMVLPVNMKASEQVELAEKIYAELRAQGIEALLDDRNERVGVKFNDAELMGIPVRIAVGKLAGEDKVEYRLRTDADNTILSSADAVGAAVQFIREGLKH